MSRISATISASCCCDSQAMAAELRDPPEYASKIFCISLLLRRVLPEPFDKRRRGAGAARDDENRVVAGDRADLFDQLRAVDRFGQRLCLSAAGPDDDELLHALDAAQERGRRPLERRQRRLRAGRLDARPLIRAVAGALDQAELLDVARDGRLRRLEAALVKPLAEQLLALERLAIDELEDDGLPARFHEGERSVYIDFY